MSKKNGGTPLLRARGLGKTYHDGRRELTVLRGVDLDVRAGESLAIVGASGSGKSTLLHLLGALDTPTAGTIELRGEAFPVDDRAAMAAIRLREVGFVFQAHHLLGEMNALENVSLPLLAGRVARGQALERAQALLERVGLGDRLTHRPAQLSGGEQQRVAIARALANEPPLLLADEPTGNLDETTGRNVADMFFESAEGRSLVIVTHDLALARRTDRQLRLHEGVLSAWDDARATG